MWVSDDIQTDTSTHLADRKRSNIKQTMDENNNIGIVKWRVTYAHDDKEVKNEIGIL